MTIHRDSADKSHEIRVLINIGEHFIEEGNISSVVRFGKGTKIILISGQEILVSAPYDKVSEIVAKHAK